MFESDFENLLKNYQEAISIRSRFSGLVKDYFPGQQMQINLILAAYDLGLAAELESVPQINNAFAYRFVKRLIEEYGISRKNADWTVAMWCVCYGERVLHKPCEIKLQEAKSSSAPAIREEKSSNRQYGDLFTYEKSLIGNGLAVTGFQGTNQHTVIFQNRRGTEAVLEIKEDAFSGTEIEEAIMTEGYLRIGKKAFSDCTKLHQIIFSQSLTEIEEGALSGCSALSAVAFPEGLRRIGAYAFADSGLKKLQIPRSVHEIGEGAFSNCIHLEQVDIPENISDISNELLKGCTNLRKVQLHKKLNLIGDEAFAGCTQLLTIYIPDSVQAIGDHAFDDMDKQFVLQCTYGSYAEEYARKNKIKYQLV